METAIRSSKRILFAIGIGLAIFLLIDLIVLYRINLAGVGPISQDVGSRTFWLNTSLFGFLGSLLFFSRRTYVYLIEDKFLRILLSVNLSKGKVSDNQSERIAIASSKMAGYYLYLVTRPLAGLVVGPIAAMAILTGLTTLISKQQDCNGTLSPTGFMVAYLIAFVGGYISSQVFDHFSRIGKKALK